MSEGGASYIPSSHRLTNDMPSTMAATFLLMLFHSFSPSLLLQLFHLGSEKWSYWKKGTRDIQ